MGGLVNLDPWSMACIGKRTDYIITGPYMFLEQRNLTPRPKGKGRKGTKLPGEREEHDGIAGQAAVVQRRAVSGPGVFFLFFLLKTAIGVSGN
jgi:hypothetical protein